jgi:uncharacterized protein
MNRLRRAVRDLIGSNESELVSSLRAQVDAARRGARLAHEVVTGGVPSDEARDAIGEIEHEGDGYRANLVDALAHSLAPPFDREDLFRLSRSIDDVLDNLRDFVREFDLFQAPEGARFERVLAAIEEGLERLEVAVEQIVEQPAELTLGALAAKKVGNQVRQEYQSAVAELLNEGPVTTELLKCRELLRRLDVVGLRLGEAADSLADGAMKRSH